MEVKPIARLELVLICFYAEIVLVLLLNSFACILNTNSNVQDLLGSFLLFLVPIASKNRCMFLYFFQYF